MNDKHDENDKHKQITITIDGQPFKPAEDHQQAASLLWLAGVDPAQYDLAIIKKHGQTEVYHDDESIHLKDGDAFVTVRQSAQVA